MAGYEEADEAITTAITKMANRAAEITGGGGASAVLTYAEAINELAEARAWLRAPNNSHAGGGKSASS